MSLCLCLLFEMWMKFLEISVTVKLWTKHAAGRIVQGGISGGIVTPGWAQNYQSLHVAVAIWATHIQHTDRHADSHV